MSADVLYVLAHQDDEVVCVTRMAYDVQVGNRPWCAFLTDGAARVGADVRDAESIAALTRIGVDAQRIIFIADQDGRIGDGLLMSMLERARRALLHRISQIGVRFSHLYTLDWEGGHADHDATHLVVLAIAADLGIDDVWAFSAYNAYRRFWKLFNVATFVPADDPIVRRPLSLAESLRAAIAFVAYHSQRRTWLALGPAWFIKMMLRREERMRRADPRRVARRPHDGPLLYSSLFGADECELFARSAAFRRELAELSPG